jgi:hypothetical protein
MLLIEPLKDGTGITLSGDYLDLVSVNETVTTLASSSTFNGDFEEFLLGLAGEVRKAWDGFRETRVVRLNEYKEKEYHSTDLIWTNVLIQAGALRYAAAYQPTTKKQQADIYRLESGIEEALINMDCKIGLRCVRWLDDFPRAGIFPSTDIILSDTELFLVGEKTGKQRFKTLPELLCRMLIESFTALKSVL